MKIFQVDYARFLAALLCVSYHAEVTFSEEKYFGHPTFPFFWGSNSGVQIFFVISGFIIYLVHGRDPEHDAAALRRFARSRFLRIYIPLWIVLAVLFPIFLLGLSHFELFFNDYLFSILALPYRRDALLSVEWTLRHEILFYALFALFIWNRRIGGTLLMLWGVGGLAIKALADAGAFDLGWFGEFLFNTNHVLFVMGMGLAFAYRRGIAVKWPVAFMLVGLAVFVWSWQRIIAIAPFDDLSNVAYGVGAAFFMAGALAYWTPRQTPAWVELLSRASYPLYLINFALVSIAAKVFTRIGHTEIWAVRALDVLVTLVVCQILAICFHLWAEKPALALLRRHGIGRVPSRRAA